MTAKVKLVVAIIANFVNKSKIAKEWARKMCWEKEKKSVCLSIIQFLANQSVSQSVSQSIGQSCTAVNSHISNAD